VFRPLHVRCVSAGLSVRLSFRCFEFCLSVLLYGFEKLLCSRISTGVLANTWHPLVFVTNVEVVTLSQLPSINEAISRRRHSLFGHVRRMDQAAPAHQTLHLSVTSRQSTGQFGTWRRRQPGRPRKRWVEQVTTSTELSLSDAWSVATDRSAWRTLRPVDGQA